MLYNIVGLIFIILAIWVGIFTLNNKNRMPFGVNGLQKDKYQIMDREKFNSIMVIQGIVMSVWLLITGVFCMSIKEVVALAYPSMTIFIHIIFSVKAKKYIKRK